MGEAGTPVPEATPSRWRSLGGRDLVNPNATTARNEGRVQAAPRSDPVLQDDLGVCGVDAVTARGRVPRDQVAFGDAAHELVRA
jgi:hypothetical protein